MSIAAFLNSSRIQSKVHAIVDNTHAFLVDPNKERFLTSMGKTPDPKLLDQYAIMDEYCPIELTDDFRALEYLLVRNQAIASVIPSGGEIPQTRTGQLQKVEGSFGKLAISHVYDEEDEIRMLELSKMASIPKAFIDLLFGSVESLQPRIVKLSNVITWQILYQGFAAYTDPRSQTAFKLQYVVPSELFPPPLAGNDLWTNYTNANAIANIRSHSRAFYAINGYYPDEVAMSQTLIDHVLSQSSTRDQALTLGLISNVSGASAPTSVDELILSKIFERLKIPKLRISDAAYEIEIAPNVNVRGRYFPDNTYVFLTKGNKRMYGPTIENQGKPGIFVKSEEVLKSSPPQSRSYAVARLFPFITQPKTLGARKVA